jgi:hypothetical protein
VDVRCSLNVVDLLDSKRVNLDKVRVRTLISVVAERPLWEALPRLPVLADQP